MDDINISDIFPADTDEVTGPTICPPPSAFSDEVLVDPTLTFDAGVALDVPPFFG